MYVFGAFNDVAALSEHSLIKVVVVGSPFGSAMHQEDAISGDLDE
jgi:hypothetical protein